MEQKNINTGFKKLRVVKDFAVPVSDLLEELNEAVDKALEDENKKKRSDKI